MEIANFGNRATTHVSYIAGFVFSRGIEIRIRFHNRTSGSRNIPEQPTCRGTVPRRYTVVIIPHQPMRRTPDIGYLRNLAILHRITDIVPARTMISRPGKMAQQHPEFDGLLGLCG